MSTGSSVSRERPYGVGRKPRKIATSPDPKTDGLGDPLVADALYYVQDARTSCGNCGFWWGLDRKGYVCSIDEAGQYTGADAAGMRATDVPWPIDYVLSRAVRHVRVDTAAFRRDKYKPGPR